MRISIEVAATHKRTDLIQQYAAEVNKRSAGRIHAEVYHSAQLFGDRDVAKALRQGGAEMATPGPWNLTGIERNMELPLTPTFYGRTPAEVHRVLDGEIGTLLNGMIEKKIGVKVVGPWLDLGASHTFSTQRPLNAPADLKGLKIRTLGRCRPDGPRDFLRGRAEPDRLAGCAARAQPEDLRCAVHDQ